jgi:hypothetical protein
MAEIKKSDDPSWRLVVVGGHTRSIGKTQLVCDVIQAFPKVEWIAGKITQYGPGGCSQNGENCDCAPTDHVSALDWESASTPGTDSARFLGAGAKRSFWLRTKQDYLAEGMSLLRKALLEVEREADPARKNALIIESNSLMQFVKPSLYFAVIDPGTEDFKESAQTALDRASALVLRAGALDPDAPPAPLWMKLPAKLLQERPSVVQREGDPLPGPIEALVYQMLDEPPGASLRFLTPTSV